MRFSPDAFRGRSRGSDAFLMVADDEPTSSGLVIDRPPPGMGAESLGYVLAGQESIVAFRSTSGIRVPLRNGALRAS